MKKRAFAILMMMVMMLSAATTFTFAASGGKTKRMTVYDEVIVDGNTAYCASGAGIYKVNLKTGKITRLLKANSYDCGDPTPCEMKLHKGYLYYLADGSYGIDFWRMKTNGKSRKYLATVYDGYAISKGKIYYNGYGKNDREGNWRIDLNGKHLTKSKYKIKSKVVKSNKSGYRIVDKYVRKELVYTYEDGEKEYAEVHKVYLKTPSKTIYIATYKCPW